MKRSNSKEPQEKAAKKFYRQHIKQAGAGQQGFKRLELSDEAYGVESKLKDNINSMIDEIHKCTYKSNEYNEKKVDTR